MDLRAGLNQHQTIVIYPHRTNFQRADPAARQVLPAMVKPLESDLTDAEVSDLTKLKR